MSPRLRRLSGNQVIAILEKSGFETVSQRGSHVKLRRMTETGAKETLTVPAHRELDVGTLRAIIRQASKYVPLEELHPEFYVD